MSTIKQANPIITLPIFFIAIAFTLIIGFIGGRFSIDDSIIDSTDGIEVSHFDFDAEDFRFFGDPAEVETFHHDFGSTNVSFETDTSSLFSNDHSFGRNVDFTFSSFTA